MNSVITNPDVAQIINSNEVQSALRPAKAQPKRSRTTHKNPLKNKTLMAKLNPYAPVLAQHRATNNGAKKAISKAQKNAFRKKTRAQLRAAYAKVHQTVQDAEAEYTELMKQTKL